MRERGKSLTTLLSKREVAISRKVATPQLKEQITNDQSVNAPTKQPINTPPPNSQAKPTNTNSPQTPKKKQSKRIPSEFKRLENWREFFLESEDEEEDGRRQKTEDSTSAIKTTVNWTKTEPEEPTEQEKQEVFSQIEIISVALTLTFVI